MSAPALVRIATRESQLALAQTRLVARTLEAARPGLRVELVPMTTRGDRVLDRPLAQVGGKGLFVKELEAAMEAGSADLAVHSLKDVPMVLPPRFALSTFGAREVAFDAFVSNRFESLAALPAGSRVGTSSLRREAQLRHAFPGLDVRALRGNVNTRLARLDAGHYEAIVLAAAGLRRLGFEHRIRALLAQSIPAIGQGILALEHRADRPDIAELVAPLEDAATAAAARAERAVGLVVEGSCEVPVGAHARVADGRIDLAAFVGLPDGSRLVRVDDAGSDAEAGILGRAVGQRLLDTGGREVLALLGAGSGRAG